MGKPEGNFGEAQQPLAAHDYALDVTAWAQRDSNFGLVLRGGAEDRNGGGNSRCETQFYTPQLEVTYK